MGSVALLGNAETQPDKIYKEDIVVRLNIGMPRKDKRTDIWFFGDGMDYTPYRKGINARRVIGYGSTHGDWFERYPQSWFNHLKKQLEGYQPCIGTMALFWLIRNGHTNINIYGIDFFKSGHFYNKKDKCYSNKIHNFEIEEKFFKQLKEVIMPSKQVKDIKNKAILEPRETKSIKPAVKVKCKKCGYAENVNRSRCWNCNAEL